MLKWNPDSERRRLETVLSTPHRDFSATYMAVQDLHALIRKHSGIILPGTAAVFKNVLEEATHRSQTQSLFLYREAAEALATMVTCSHKKSTAEQAMETLEEFVRKADGHAHRAAAEALGSLPLHIRGPQLRQAPLEEIPLVKWAKMLDENGITGCRPPEFAGRSLITAIDEKGSVLVVKLASSQGFGHAINLEAAWMKLLQSGCYSFPTRFDVPSPIKIGGSYVFRLKGVPAKQPAIKSSAETFCAIGFITHKDYFLYPNEHRHQKQLTRDRFREVISRNAWLLGNLAGSGIIHSAPIPLFHNRVQRNRRSDRGIYEWPRGGRLDQWLYSCRYPNFGMTGIRDFEHLEAIQGAGRRLYQDIGTHLLSFLLVTASYFRNQDPARVGFDGQGRPVDARDLFDQRFLKKLIQDIYLNYYDGFCGEAFSGQLPFDLDELSARMIEEMGVDRYMEEILRATDQVTMSEKVFRDFLSKRGYGEAEMGSLARGIQDIAIHSGPHLGGFNDRISLPELIQFLATASAFCIAGKYRRQKLKDLSRHRSDP